jgi:hypothetical protein
MENPTRSFLLDSDLFTQVEPEWLVESQGYCTLVNKSRGVVAVVHEIRPLPKIVHNNESDSKPFSSTSLAELTARMFFDCGQQTYHSSGWYNLEELEQWVLPVMRSDRAWAKYNELVQVGECDLTVALEFV